MRTLYGDNFPSKIKPYLHGEKNLADDTNDEPPTQRTKVEKLIEIKSMEKNTIIQDLIDVGYTTKDAIDAYNKTSTEQLLKAKLESITTKEQLALSSRKKRVTIKLSKAKGQSKPQSKKE